MVTIQPQPVTGVAVGNTPTSSAPYGSQATVSSFSQYDIETENSRRALLSTMRQNARQDGGNGVTAIAEGNDGLLIEARRDSGPVTVGA